MKLKTHLPARMLEAVLQDLLGVLDDLRTIHGLEDEGAEIEMFEISRRHTLLRVDELQLIAAINHDGCARLRRDADPVDSGRNRESAIGFDRELEAGLVERVDEGRVELKKGLTARAHHKRIAFIYGPEATRSPGQIGGRLKSPTHRPVSADEIGITPLTASAATTATIGFTARPEVAACRANEDCDPARLKTFALDAEEDLLHEVAHR